jgi:hypothetical protein
LKLEKVWGTLMFRRRYHYLKVRLSARPASSIGVCTCLVGFIDSSSQPMVRSIEKSISNGVELEADDQLFLVNFPNVDEIIDAAILRTESEL